MLPYFLCVEEVVGLLQSLKIRYLQAEKEEYKRFLSNRGNDLLVYILGGEWIEVLPTMWG
ncbi:hypothetical protein MALU111345_03585 [Marinicrinis lubricantis]